jgi:predicted transcriptional regulator
MRVGAIELRLLEHVAAAGPTSVRDASDTFGREHGIGLTTVLQMMERLRKKELLERHRVEGIWVYRGVESRENVLKGVVMDFVDRTLGGSLEPFMLYLADRSKVSEAQLQEVREIVERLSGEASGEAERDHGK